MWFKLDSEPVGFFLKFLINPMKGIFFPNMKVGHLLSDLFKFGVGIELEFLMSEIM